MGVTISGSGIDIGGNPVSNVDVGANAGNAATLKYVQQMLANGGNDVYIAKCLAVKAKYLKANV